MIRRRAAPARPATVSAAGPIVVGLGASAGGLEALGEFFAQVPADSGLTFVVVTHQHPGYVSLLPELLGKQARIPVAAAVNGMRLEPDRVYVGPSGSLVALSRGRLRLIGAVGEEARHLPIDFFFRSLAQDRKERAVGIVLSGTGSDGTLGLKAIKAESGLTLAQEVGSAKYAGMPSSAIATGLVDYTLAPAAMPAQLVAYARGPYLTGRPEPVVARAEGEPLHEIFQLLRSRTRHDFSEYKIATIRRRVERRMNVHQIKDPADYVRLLQQNPAELDLLFKELLISVTSFFRDREVWTLLSEKVVPEMLRRLPDDYHLRVWVPGCATGEEAYSVAILLRDAIDRGHRRIGVQIFGTDLDTRAIDVARAGDYPEGIAADVPPAYLARYFTRTDHHYRIGKEIREMVVFAPQNLINDPPFTRLDWISCRNLLIYLNADLQKRLLPLFHYALKPGGLLLLGSSETIGEHKDLFAIVDRKWKIYTRRSTADVPVLRHFPARASPVDAVPSKTASPPSGERPPPISRVMERLLLERFAPAGVLVNDRGEVVYIHGRTGRYLEPASGESARPNVLEMARDGLEMELRSALREAVSGKTDVVRPNVLVRSEGVTGAVDVTVHYLGEPGPLDGLLLVTFQPVATPLPRSGGRERAGTPRRVAQLLRELKEAKASLHLTVEELAAANDELRSANEELQSTNEEMQSTNEELETSREEMQSLNEELTTVNAEQQARVEELARARDDMQNILNSTDIATLFLDNDLRIRRYTESVGHLIHLIPGDVGRPISDQTSKLKLDDLAATCGDVLKTLRPKQVEVETTDGAWYLMRVLPYRTLENVIDGLVITFVNITEVTLAEKTGREARAYFESIFNTVRHPLLVLDEQLRLVSANRAYYDAFRLRPRQVEGESIFELGSGEWDIPDLRHLLQDVLPEQKNFDGLRVEHDFPRIGPRTFLLNARRLERETGLPGMILLAMEDVTPR